MSDKIDKGYFDRFPDRLMENLDAMDDDLSIVAPILSGLDKREPYLVPKEYFNTAQKNLLVKTGTTKSPWFHSISFRMAIAAMLLFCCTILAAVLWPKAETLDQGLELAEIDYLEGEIGQIDDRMLVDLFNEVDEINLDFEMIEAEDLEIYFDQLLYEMSDEELSDLL